MRNEDGEESAPALTDEDNAKAVGLMPTAGKYENKGSNV
jgi:hypothetical protein